MTMPSTPLLDIDQLRADTPGCAHVTHLNNAGASLMPQPVIDAVKAYLDLEAITGGYEAAKKKAADIDHTYDAIAKLIGARRNEIALLTNATQAWAMAFYAIDFQPGDVILTAQAEYASNYIAYLHMAQKRGVNIQVIPNDVHGQLCVTSLKEAITDKVKLISITHIPTNSGLINPAEAVGQVAQEHGILYLLDACQSVGQMPIDVNAIGCHLLSATGRKYLRGPRGTGFLYANTAVLQQLDPPILDLHSATWSDDQAFTIRDDARRFETWEANYGNILGLGAAADYALNLGLNTLWPRIQELATMLRNELKAIPHIQLQDIGEKHCGIVSFTSTAASPEAIASTLATHNIHVSTSPMVYSRLDMSHRNIDCIVRASVHYYNTEAEIHRLCEQLNALPQGR